MLCNKGKSSEGLAVYREVENELRQASGREAEELLCDLLGDSQKTLDCYQRQLSIARELGDQRGMSIPLTNMGELYRKQGMQEQALTCYCECIAICRAIGDQFIRAYALSGEATSCSSYRRARKRR